MQSSKLDQDRRSPLVCLLAAPATSPAVLYGLYDVLASAGVVYGEMTTGEAGDPLLEVRIVAAGAEPFRCFGGVLVEPHAAIADVPATDVAIVCECLHSDRRACRRPLSVRSLKTDPPVLILIDCPAIGTAGSGPKFV